MFLRLKFSKPKYSVKGITTYCTYTCQLVDTEINKVLNQWVSIGRTTVSGNDKFDEVEGKHIAQTKAKYAAYRLAKQYSEDLLKSVYPIYRNVDSFDIHMQHMVRTEKEHLDKLMKRD